MTQTVEFVVTGEEKMYCAGCEQRVGNALRRLPGVTNVQANAQTQQVVVTFEPSQVTAEQVQTKLTQIGYHATVSGASR